MTEYELKIIQNLAGPINKNDLKYVDYYLSEKMSVFLPSVGPCQYSITPDHSHPGYLFIYAYDDLCKTKINDKIIISKKGKITAISPGVIHHEIVDDCFSRYAALIIEQKFFNDICKIYGVNSLNNFTGNEFDPPETFSLLIRDFMIEADNKMPGYTELLSAITLRICHALVRILFNIPSAVHKISSRLDIEEVIQYMNANYQKNITIKDLSVIMKRSSSAFMRIFKEETGVSPVEFLIQIRLERARKLLLSTTQTVTEIAFNCGFNSSSHFTATFSKKFGMNPRNYKKYHSAG